jgi:hypothetical protein
MKRYLIETPHSVEECQMLVDEVFAMGYLYHFDWACKAGVHTGWAIIEAEDEELARLAVPALVRSKSRVIEVTKGEPSAAKSLHPRKQQTS